MDIVLLLGAGAEPAQSIARRLVGLGSKVYGLANKFPEQGFAHRDFLQVPVNPADPAAVRAEVEKIVAREGAVGTVILAGHNPVEDAFEAAHPNDVALAVFAGLAAPLAAVRAAMPGLIKRRGLVLTITRPVFGPGAALGGVVEAGLASFCDGLFGELRDTGTRVCHLRIQENPGAGDPAARYTSTPQTRVQPDIVADTVEAVMRLRENNAITRVVLRPQATREEPRLPVTAEPRLASLQVVQLPVSRNYPPAEEKIFTPEYRRPDYAPPPGQDEEDEDDEGDDAVDPELAYLIKPRHRDRFVRDTAPDAAGNAPEEPGDAPQEERAPEQRRHNPQSAPQKQYHNPYQPAQQQQQRQPRHGAMRIQPPNTGDEPRGDRPQNAGGQPRPGGNGPDLHPKYRQEQEARRQQQQSGETADNRPPRRIEQMPRPQGWQGPRYPQSSGQNPAQGNNRPQNSGNGNAGETAPRPRDNGPDLHPGYRREQEARQGAAPRQQDTREPRIFTDADGHPVGGQAPVAKPAPVASPRPVIVPVEKPADAGEPVAASGKNASGRSEAVVLSFDRKPEIPVKPPLAKGEVKPAVKPAVEKIVKAERDEEIDEAPLRLKKRPATKKTPAKADKALARVEAKISDEPDADETSVAEAKPVKPKRPAAKKKA